MSINNIDLVFDTFSVQNIECNVGMRFHLCEAWEFFFHIFGDTANLLMFRVTDVVCETGDTAVGLSGPGHLATCIGKCILCLGYI